MDSTKDYILMCEKALEIQVQKTWPKWYNRKDGPCCIHPKWEVYESPWYINEPKYENCDWVWLPRQDQLQRMITLSSRVQLIHDFNEWIEYTFEKNSEFLIARSMEQLWLSFVMFMNYGKIWNGEDWIKEK